MGLRPPKPSLRISIPAPYSSPRGGRGRRRRGNNILEHPNPNTPIRDNISRKGRSLTMIFGLFTVGITGDPEVRCQSYYEEGYMRMFIIYEDDDANRVGQMESDLITRFRGSRHLQNTKAGMDSIHQLLKYRGPYYTSEWGVPSWVMATYNCRRPHMGNIISKQKWFAMFPE